MGMQACWTVEINTKYKDLYFKKHKKGETWTNFKEVEIDDLILKQRPKA